MSGRYWVVALIVVLIWAGSLSAEVIFDADTTINYAIDDDVRILGAEYSPGPGPDFDPPVINVLAGADISGTVRVFDTVLANFSGGTIRSRLYGNGGLVPPVLNFSGTRFEKAVHVGPAAIVNVSGGVFYQGFRGATAVVNVSGGEFYNNEAGSGALQFDSGAALSVSGGVVFGDTYLGRSSTGTISGGHLVGGLEVSNSTADLFGGWVDDRLRVSYGEIHLFGGRIEGDLHASYGGTIHVHGYDLLHADSSLTGRLADGSLISVSTVISVDGQWPDGQIVLHQIPEPAVGVLAMWAMLAMAVTTRVQWNTL